MSADADVLFEPFYELLTFIFDPLRKLAFAFFEDKVVFVEPLFLLYGGIFCWEAEFGFACVYEI